MRRNIITKAESYKALNEKNRALLYYIAREINIYFFSNMLTKKRYGKNTLNYIERRSNWSNFPDVIWFIDVIFEVVCKHSFFCAVHISCNDSLDSPVSVKVIVLRRDCYVQKRHRVFSLQKKFEAVKCSRSYGKL
jgi:hypothetical protein